MEGNASKTEVEDFLKQVKSILKESGSFQFIKRRKNIDSMNKYGLTIDTIKMYIKNLQVTDYFQGPVEDHDLPGYVWMFGKTISGIIFYIKLKIKKGQLVCCLSFHEADYGIRYPFK